MSAEKWARATWERGPTVVRWFLACGWRLILGLRLAPGRSSTHVLGWRLISNQPGSVTLEARSRLIVAHNVVIIQDFSVLWTTLVRYESPLGRLIWRLVEPVHRIVMPYTLSHAAKVGQREPGRQS